MFSGFVMMAVLGAPVPGESRLDIGELTRQVIERRKDGPASAAGLAAEGAGRTELALADRAMLGGLARQDYELAFRADKNPTHLCDLLAVTRVVTSLAIDATTREQFIQAARAAEDQLGRLGHVCVVDEAKATEAMSPPSQVTTRPSLREAALKPSSAPALSTVDRNRTGGAPEVDRRRARAGVGLMIPGLALLAPTAAVLVLRSRGEAELRALRAEGRLLTDEENTRAAALDRLYTRTTAAAAVLGVTSAALAITGVVLLATRHKPSRVALAPWGSRGAGGLVLAGRF